MTVGAVTAAPPPSASHGGGAPGRWVPWIVIAAGTAVVLLVGAALVLRAHRAVNRVPLGAAPRPVSVVEAETTTYRGSRSYVGTLEPWVEASVGPQFVSAYVATVLVRPGAVVRRGDVLATLDCSNENAQNQASAMQARAVEENQRALTDETTRVAGLLDRGFVAQNEVERSTARSSAAKAQLLESRARLASASLRVSDCVLRAPFAGEIATRWIDPGAFVHPGAEIVSVVDRGTVRIVADAPEKDFGLLAPDTVVQIEVLATGRSIVAAISRRAPKADPRTRTLHFEIDVSDPDRSMPVGTTGIVKLDIGTPLPAAAVPAYVATVRNGKAHLFVIEGAVAHAREVGIVGESRGRLFLDPRGLPAHATIVTEGRALLSDGDTVRPTVEPPDTPTPPSSAPRGGGFGRPQ